MKIALKSIALVILSPILGMLLMDVLGRLLDAMNWPNLNTWGLAHSGAIVVVWPVLTCVAFLFLAGVFYFRRAPK